LLGQPVLLDAAHNIDSLRWLALKLAEQMAASGPSEGFPVMFGCQVSRDPAEMLRALQPVTKILVPVEIPVLHPCPLARIVEAAEKLGIAWSLPAGLSASDIPADYEIGHVTELDPPDNRTRWIETTQHALGLATAQRPLVICGSIYNMGEIMRVFEDMQTSSTESK
jgi:folylpolyglutamate synthase/dihydropteroate synthase